MFKSVDPKPNFPEMEKKILEKWYKEGIVEKYLHKNDSSKKRFSFIDGPITANNPMGVHHAWGRTYKDLWQRFYNLRGFKQRFQNGFDCQGLWVEVEVEKELGLKSKKDIENLVPGDKKASIARFVELCKERVRKYSAIQTEQSKRLGYFMDWDHSYYTMSDENNYMIWHFLKVCHEKGWIYKGKDSVPWCPRCETAISQHEMLTEDYKEIIHESIYLRLPIENREKEYLLVWTTTPWTLPANIAVTIDKDIDYCLVQENSGNSVWLAKDLVEKVFNGKDKKIQNTVKGKKLAGLRYKAPFDNFTAVREVSKENKDHFHLVVATDQNILPVTTNEGTGLVHTAVSAGAEDFALGKKYNLPMIPVIADNADYLPNWESLAGKNAKKNPRIILDYLLEEDQKSSAWVFAIEKYKHRYPACWRCKTELVWKVADEWYIGMDRKGIRQLADKNQKSKGLNKTFREQMIEVAKKIKWKPEFGLDRELDWLANMHDWLISKPNRYWGLALPIWECGKCGHFEVIGSKEELVEKAVLGWEKFNGHTPHKPYIDEVKIKCIQCGEIISRLPDVANVWLDAGIVPYATLVDPKTKKLSYTSDKKYWQEWFPADFITESFPGQFKNWFYSLIAESTGLENKAPFKTVLGFGTLFGEDGRPMHKSWGNAIEFNEGADTIGVDVMRWMYLTHNPEQNLCFGYKTADEVRRKFHLLLWNIYNFFVTYAKVDNWQPNKKLVSLSLLDQWILVRLKETISVTTVNLETYDIQKAALSIEGFVNDLSLWYIRRSRDRIGPSTKNNADKNATHATLYTVLLNLIITLAPFNPFITEEIYKNLTGKLSVHLEDWPGIKKVNLFEKKLIEEMKLIREIVKLGHAERKVLNIKVRQPLSQAIISYTDNKPNENLSYLLKEELNVKSLKWLKTKVNKISFNKQITPDLKDEGEARDIVRFVQEERKKFGCGISDKIELTLPFWPENFTALIKRATLAETIVQGKEIIIKISPV